MNRRNGSKYTLALVKSRMRESCNLSQVSFPEPPVPKARPPIGYLRNSKNSVKNMHKLEQENQKFLDNSDDEIVYTDDDDDDDDDYDDDDDNNSYSELLNDRSQSFLHDSFSSACNSPVTARINRRYVPSPSTSRSANVTNNSSVSYQQSRTQPKHELFTRLNMFLISAIVILFFVICMSCKRANEQTISKIEKHDIGNVHRIVEIDKADKMLNKWIKQVQGKFHNQKSDIWNDIFSGIYDAVLYPNKPTVIILFGNKTDTLNCLAQLLGQMSGVVLGSNDYLTLTPENFPNDVGETIHNLKGKILQKRAVIVQDLLSINSEAMKAFHNFCDRQKPLVKHAIYIITVIVDEYNSSQKELEFIEGQIFKKLSGKIEKDILDPLIARITDGVVAPVLPANFNHNDCSISEFRKS